MKTIRQSLIEAMESYRQVERFINEKEDYNGELPDGALLTSPWENCLVKKITTRFDKECRKKLNKSFNQTNTSSDEACTIHYKGIDLNLGIHHYYGIISQSFGYTNTDGKYTIATIS